MYNNRIIPALSLPLGVLVIIVSVVGLFSPGFYAAETANWRIQTTGQDIIDLVLVAPCLLISGFLAYRNNKVAAVIWCGSIFYLAYTFALYCFNIHFNRLFIVYCLCLSLALYSGIYFLVTEYKDQIFFKPGKNALSPYIGFYFILIASLFYMLWLSEIIPANLQNTIPASLKETGLFTNGVHVLDLAILLPAIIIIGILLLRGRVIGFILTPVLLVFFILMDVTIGLLQYLMKIKNLTNHLGVMYIMLSLAVISMVLLMLFFRYSKPSISL